MTYLFEGSVAAVGGIVAGLIYYGGLWWTLQRLANATRPALLLGMSFLARTVLILLMLLWLTDLQFTLILIFMAAFVVTRVVLTRRWGPHDTGAIPGGSNHGTDA